MLALTLDESQVRGFMNRLLKEELFDAFEVRSVEINALTRVDVSGELSGDSRTFATWAQLRPLVVAIIKNHQMPRYLKIIFSYAAETVSSIHQNASALFLNLVYESGGLHFTAATAQKLFSLDKSLDEEWEKYVNSFFSRNGVPVKNKE